MSDDADSSRATDGSEDGLVEVVRAEGHENVTAEHVSTLEFTSDDFLTPAGDCILAVEADRVPADFDPEFVDACQAHGATITATIEAGEQLTEDNVALLSSGMKEPGLEPKHYEEVVGRTAARDIEKDDGVTWDDLE